MYPELACREALVNAIAHRDYAEEGRGIEIYVYDDRMEVRNLGALLSSIQMDDLKKLTGAHQSAERGRRPNAARLGLHEGARGGHEENVRANAAERTNSAGVEQRLEFLITLKHQTVYTPKQKLWLDQFDHHDLSREQKAIVVMGFDGNLVAPQDIWDSLGIVDTEHYRQLDRLPRELGILKSEVPKAKAQKMAHLRKTTVRHIPRFKILKESERDAGVAQEQVAARVNEEMSGNLLEVVRVVPSRRMRLIRAQKFG